MSEQITVVIFGASGDLTHRKLVPALYAQHVKGRLPDTVRIVGTARSQMTDDEFRERMRDGAKEFVPEQYDDAKWDEFALRITYAAADAAKPDGMAKVLAALDCCNADV
jgi:glucose-6-phosphate 1-dehydrogenase